MMDAAEIKKKISRIETMIAAWEQGRAVSDIERELVLDMLREAYGAVMFLQPERMDGIVRDAAPEEDVPCCTESVGVAAETVVVRQIDRKAILSLYDSDTKCERSANPADAPQPEVSGEVEGEKPGEPPVADAEDKDKEPEPEKIAVPAEEKSETAPLATAPEEEKTVAGSPAGSGKTIGETFAANGDQTIMAEKLAAERPAGLRAIIELNDRFLLMKELFDGDASAYDRAIDALDALTDFDDAIIHIHENYDWNPDCDGVKLMVELLTRCHSGATSTPT